MNCSFEDKFEEVFSINREKLNDRPGHRDMSLEPGMSTIL